MCACISRLNWKQYTVSFWNLPLIPLKTYAATGKVLFQIRFIFPFIDCLRFASFAAWFLSPNTASPHTHLHSKTAIYLCEVWCINYNLDNVFIWLSTIHSFLPSCNKYLWSAHYALDIVLSGPKDIVVSTRDQKQSKTKQKAVPFWSTHS